MKPYRVYFTKYYDYYVEAENENEAIDIAEAEFRADMSSPIADTTYDEVGCDRL